MCVFLKFLGHLATLYHYMISFFSAHKDLTDGADLTDGTDGADFLCGLFFDL